MSVITPPGGSGRRVAGAAGRSAGRAAVSIIAIVVLWVAGLRLFQVPAFVGKGPLDVIDYFFTLPKAAQNRSEALHLLGATLGDALVGFAAGLGVALVIAALFQLVQSVESALMPIVLLLQSVPLIAMAPILVLIFGRSTVTVAVMGGLVVLFPALVNITFGLRSAPRTAIDLVTVYGATRWQALRKVALPSAWPALFAAVRISVPGAITGALIAEWLATGKGIGYAIVAAVGESRIGAVWALAVLITLATLLLYQLIGVIESAVLTRMGFAQT
ncbi:ABC-type nitrate/sulfonate/bicarbonate transport system permease component [Actinoplanes lutulentus]|uniref:ABC-type nitrate/sulfonate/bicarbonate transport system permease component n=1 Tax=Actinoplanes lutulentus TaxID=1287878 RepID=A0A327YXM0_9ACTN|nr:ABC transporter permease subunit [Actinoplanes lutulentus]MBB2946513.1 ABC-type nitrate/sulfonate/bicarbonate transport system permease component [Actinoplanes lutulentus]RAK26431.1 ABC-type nitrate/sulfonate/bicarbonate transport system permease component [Actinoplanes lutulentus]